MNSLPLSLSIFTHTFAHTLTRIHTSIHTKRHTHIQSLDMEEAILFIVLLHIANDSSEPGLLSLHLGLWDCLLVWEGNSQGQKGHSAPPPNNPYITKINRQTQLGKFFFLIGRVKPNLPSFLKWRDAHWQPCCPKYSTGHSLPTCVLRRSDQATSTALTTD